MLARLALEEDIDAVIRLARMQVAETLPHLEFSEEVTRETFMNYMNYAAPTIFVAEQDRKIIGYLVAHINNYAMSAGHFCNQEVIYVEPDKRGTRAAASLVKLFNAWADRTGAKEVFMGIANGFQPERTARFMQHFGFSIVGSHLRRVR